MISCFNCSFTFSLFKELDFRGKYILAVHIFGILRVKLVLNTYNNIESRPWLAIYQKYFQYICVNLRMLVLCHMTMPVDF